LVRYNAQYIYSLGKVSKSAVTSSYLSIAKVNSYYKSTLLKTLVGNKDGEYCWANDKSGMDLCNGEWYPADEFDRFSRNYGVIEEAL